jgi:hypothetical protein
MMFGGLGTVLSAFYSSNGVRLLTLWLGMFQFCCSVVLSAIFMMGVLGGPIGIMIFIIVLILHLAGVFFYSAMCWKASKEVHFANVNYGSYAGGNHSVQPIDDTVRTGSPNQRANASNSFKKQRTSK